MSKIGKKPVAIPQGVTVELKDGTVFASGPLGKLSVTPPAALDVSMADQHITVAPRRLTPQTHKLWGTWRALIQNLIDGVSKGFSKGLIIEGLGYGAEKKGSDLVIKIGYSHPVAIPVPETLSVKVEKNLITVSGISKEAVGQFAAGVRARKPPEPYHGKGIRYQDEIIIKKQIKKV